MSVIYEFACPVGHDIEAFYPMGEAPDAIACPDHNAASHRRMAGASVVAFPGSYRYDWMPRPHRASIDLGGQP